MSLSMSALRYKCQCFFDTSSDPFSKFLLSILRLLCFQTFQLTWESTISNSMDHSCLDLNNFSG